MAKTSKSGAVQLAALKVPWGLLFELETTCVKGRKILFNALKKVLADRGVDLTPHLFLRYCLHSSVSCFLEPLLEEAGKKRVSKEKVADEVNAEIKRAFSSPSLALDPAIEKVLDAAQEMGIRMGALSCLPGNLSQQLMRKLELEERRVKLLVLAGCDRVFPTADYWLKLAKQLPIQPAFCMVLASSAAASRAALVAGMYCAAVPDEFTVFEDYSGTDFVVDEAKPSLLREMQALRRVS